MVTKYIQKSKDLQTSRRSICDGFLAVAILKTEKAKPYIEEANKFHKALKGAKSVTDLLSLTEYRNALISACGFSDKAKSKLTSEELDSAIKQVLDRIHKESGDGFRDGFRDGFLYRYLLTKGDALGGSMRNIAGASAGVKFVERILSQLSDRKINTKIIRSGTGKIQRIIWNGRMLLFDTTPKLIKKNIDVILLNSGKAELSEEELLSDENKYIACGELKGGIDPAGADEHWKTANSALGRIRKAFGRKCPALFFVGAAIEASMAKEIFGQLKKNKLSYAANLNDDNQVDNLVNWLIHL